MLELGVGMGAGDDRHEGLASRACSTTCRLRSLRAPRRRCSARAPRLAARQHSGSAALPRSPRRRRVGAPPASGWSSITSSGTLRRSQPADDARRPGHSRQTISWPLERRRASVHGAAGASGVAASVRLLRRRCGRAAAKSTGLSRIEMIAPARIRSRALLRQQRRAQTPRPARMKENSPICARLAEIVSAVAVGWRKASTISEGGERLADHDDEQRRQQRPAAARSRIAGSNSMPTETKNSTAKASRSGSVSCAACWLSSRFAQDHAGEERAEREGDAEQLGRAEGDAERDRQHREPEQFARAGVGDVVQHPRDRRGGRPPA